MRELWASRPYRLLFLAGFLSELGTYISEVALLMRIFELVEHQKQYLGITQGIFLVLMILGTLCGGVFGEGRGKTKILIACECARIPLLVAMLAFKGSPWVLIWGNGLVAFFSGAFNPTRQALMNEILPGELLPRANAVFSSSFAFLHAIGPVLGALFYGTVQSLSPILMMDLATYFIGVALLLRLPLAPPLSVKLTQKQDSGFFEDLRAGWSLIGTNAGFAWMILRCIIASSALGIVIPLLLPMTTEVLHLPESAYGLLLGIFGFGGAIGSLVMSRYFEKFAAEAVLRPLVAGEAASLLLWALNTIPWVSFLLAFFYGGCLFARIASQLNFVSFKLPGAFNARANALLDLAMVVPNVAGAGVVALTGSSLGSARMLQATAVLLCAGIFASYLAEGRKAPKALG
jgi:MFS family permease